MGCESLSGIPALILKKLLSKRRAIFSLWEKTLQESEPVRTLGRFLSALVFKLEVIKLLFSAF